MCSPAPYTVHHPGWHPPPPITSVNWSPNTSQGLRSSLDAPNQPQQFLFSRKQVFSLSQSMPILQQPSWETASCDRLKKLLQPRLLPILSEPCIRRHGAGGVARKSWRDSATVSEHLGLDAFPWDSFSQGLPPWCSVLHYWPWYSLWLLRRPQPSSSALHCTSALARLPPADVELWTYGSVAPGVGPNSSSTSTVCCTPLKLIQPASSLRTSVKRLSPSVWASLP